jgi:PhnB protein
MATLFMAGKGEHVARTSIYLNFAGKTEEAFTWYRTVFGTEFTGPLMRMNEAPAAPGAPALSAAEKNLVMHVELPITGGHVLMGADAVESMGHRLTVGTNVSIMLQPDTREEARRLFEALSSGGKVTMPLQDMFWGDYYGSLTDRFGVQWMVNRSQRPAP